MKLRRRIFFLLITTVAVTLAATLVGASPASADPTSPYIGPGPGYTNDVGGVACVQAAVGVPIDGVYGEQTYQAVMNYQASMGLEADGVVGPLTGDVIMAGLNDTMRSNCAPDLPTTFYLMDDEGSLAGGGTVYNKTSTGDLGGVVDAGKPIGDCIVSGIESKFTGAVSIAKVLWKRKLPTARELRAAPNPLFFIAGTVACSVLGVG